MATSSSTRNDATLEDVILALPPAQRDAVAELRTRAFNAEKRAADCDTELAFSRQRIQDLEGQLAALQNQPPPLPAPLTNLQELIALMKAQHQAQVEAVRRHTAENIHTAAEDVSFDAEKLLMRVASTNLHPPPKNFEFVDLLQLREEFSADGFAPSAPLHQPLIHEFIGHIDGVRQCTRDGRFASMYRDPVKIDLVRQLFEMCKTVEVRLGSTAHLALPSTAIALELAGSDLSETEVAAVRRREVAAYMQSLEQCGEVFVRSVDDIIQLKEMDRVCSELPKQQGEFDRLGSAMAEELEHLQRNESILVDAGSKHIDGLARQRLELVDQSQKLSVEIEKGERAVDDIFNEIFKLLAQAEEGYRGVMHLVDVHAKLQIDISVSDARVTEMKKAVEIELQKQQRFMEGAKLTTFLANKGKDLYRRLCSNLEETIRSRTELSERVKLASQEQLYAMAATLHENLVKRQVSDLQALRSAQLGIENANRALIGLIHQPQEMERQMQSIRELSLHASHLKSRLSQVQNDITGIKNMLSKYNTIAYLHRESSNFLHVYEAQEKAQRLHDKLEDVIQRFKYVSEILVEVSDPDTRQDYVVEQCMEALKSSVADATEIGAVADQMSLLEASFRASCAAKLRRHKRLVSHFLAEIEDGSNGIATEAPAMQPNVVSLLSRVDTIIAALEGKQLLEDAAPPNARPSTSSSLMDSRVREPSGSTMMRHSEPPRRGEEVTADHTFARCSSKLKISADSTRLYKPAASTVELSNTSALGAVEFSEGSGIHSYYVRLGSLCGRLLVGVADRNLPLDGYCNSIKYRGCYYLHVGNGTLWAPGQSIERKAYTFEAIASVPGSVLKVVVDTNNRTLSFVVNDTNLGIAFRDMNMTHPLYPAFEVFSYGCTLEFVNEVEKGGELR